MDDKNVMENILLLEKGVCDLYVHGVIESSTSNVHQTFSHALSDSLAMQDTLYDKMAAKGWYPTDRAEMTKVQAVKKKFQSMNGSASATSKSGKTMRPVWSGFTGSCGRMLRPALRASASGSRSRSRILRAYSSRRAC